MTSSRVSPSVPAFSLGQRVYNTVSYAGAAAVMLPFFARGGVAGRLAGALWIFHFLRRTVESLWVHRFSGRAVPPADYLIEYAYYWGFGAWIGWGLFSADYSPQRPQLFALGLVIFVLGQVGNVWAHQKLRKLRPQSGVKEKALPEGGLFSLIACPHYLFEILTWVGFALLSGVWGALAFSVVGAVILASYAFDRQKKYREEFDGKEGRPLYPKERRALIPFVF